jgi:hypothetical protein
MRDLLDKLLAILTIHEFVQLLDKFWIKAVEVIPLLAFFNVIYFFKSVQPILNLLVQALVLARDIRLILNYLLYLVELYLRLSEWLSLVELRRLLLHLAQDHL